MSITVNLSEYTQTRSLDFVDQNGKTKTLKIRQMSSAEQLRLMALAEDAKRLTKDDSAESIQMLEEIEKIYFNLYEKPEEARKMLNKLNYDAWLEIYAKAFTQEQDNG